MSKLLIQEEQQKRVRFSRKKSLMFDITLYIFSIFVFITTTNKEMPVHVMKYMILSSLLIQSHLTQRLTF